MNFFKIRRRSESYDADPVRTMPKNSVSECILTAIRNLYRRVKFLIFSVCMALAYCLLVPSGKLEVLRKLHYRDLSDALRNDDYDF